MNKLMTKENGIMLGVAALAFVSVSYLLNQKKEEKSNFAAFRKLSNNKVPARGGLVERPRRRNSIDRNTANFSGADGGCGCGG